MQEQEKPSYLKGAAILTAASVIVKIVGAIYKIPLFQDGVLGDEGAADFNVTYSVYSLILTISVAGVPTALSRLISSARARGDDHLASRYFKVAMPGFFIIGFAAMLVMFFLADGFASIMGNSQAALGIRVLSPAVLFVCIISVYRGYAQGCQNMLPTAVSQIVEVLSKAIFGITAALWLVHLGYQSQQHIVSAGAIVGVTIGLGLCIPVLYRYKKKMDKASAARETETAKTAEQGRDGGQNAPHMSRMGLFGHIMKVSIPITLTATFVSLMTVIDNAIVLNRLQDTLSYTEPGAQLLFGQELFDTLRGLGDTESGARTLFGIHSRVLSVYNLVPALLVPISVSIIPAIAANVAARRNQEAKSIMQSGIKIVNLIAMPAAVGLMVLATPILITLYDDHRQLAATILLILGAASFFVCLQYITTSILQAHGFERISLLIFPIGAACKIALTWVLTAIPEVNVLASAISTLVCFFIISALNILFIKIKLKNDRPQLLGLFLGPGLCSVVMAAVTGAVYAALQRAVADRLGSLRLEAIAVLAASIFTGIAVYGVLVIISRTVTMDDMKLVPRGEKLGKLLRIRAAKTPVKQSTEP